MCVLVLEVQVVAADKDVLKGERWLVLKGLHAEVECARVRRLWSESGGDNARGLCKGAAGDSLRLVGGATATQHPQQ